MDDTAQQEALGINEILRSIYGFVLGTNLNRIAKNMQTCLVSQQFNKCFIAYLKSAHLKLLYYSRDSCECHIVKWMKSHEITRLFELNIDVPRCLQRVNVNFTGLDFSNLSELHLKFGQYSTHSDEQLQYFLSLFSEASSVKHLKVFDYNRSLSSVVSYLSFLPSFPILKSLIARFENNTNADTYSITRSIENCPQLERLVHFRLIGNYTLRSHSLKYLNLSTCDLDSICLDCPSLEKLVCRNPVVIGNTSGSTLAEEFRVEGVAFRKEYHEINGFWPNSNTIRKTSISIIPSGSIGSTANNLFQVGNDCRIILLTSM